MLTTTPVRPEVVVPVGAERAFALLTDHIGAWWPIGQSTVVLEHSGRERLAKPKARKNDDTGWIFVVGQCQAQPVQPVTTRGSDVPSAGPLDERT